MKKNLILSFFIPLIFLVLIFLSNGIIFGDNSILYSDSQYQYYQFLIYLKNVFDGLSNFKYSFQISFGSSMISTISYYLVSPLNLFLYFFDNIELFFLFQLLTKISLSGLTMYKYLQYQENSNYALVFSTSYALSSFMICNYFQMMWLDSYMLAPLLLLGIDKIIKEKKNLLYGISLFFIIFSNYYNGYMCALFSVIYFIYKYIKEGKKNKKIIEIFLITSVLSGLATMFIHIPNLLEIIELDRSGYKYFFFNKDIIGILSKLYLGSSDGNILNMIYPYLYIGMFNLILLIFYFINNKICKKEKILSLILIVLLIISVLFEPINNFWHALSSPIGFNFRYTFLFNIVIISMCYKSFLNIDFIKKKNYCLVLILFLILSLLVFIRGLFPYIYLIISIILFIVYLILFYIKDKDLKILFCLLAIAELFFNGFAVLKSYSFTDRYYINGVYNEKKKSINIIDDSSFYRMEFDKRFGFNDPIHYGYYGVSNFISSSNLNEDFYNKIGYYARNNMTFYNHSIVLDSIFGFKYYESLDEIDYYDLKGQNKISALDGMLYGTTYTNSYIYENPYVLNLGYMVSSDSKLNFVCEDGFDCQNKMLNQMIGYENDVFIVEKVNDNKITINNKNNFYVLPIVSSDETTFPFCVGDVCKTMFIQSNKVMYIENNYEIKTELSIKYDNAEVKDIYIAYIDFDKFISNYNQLKNNQLDIRVFKEDYIKGNIYVEDKNVLFLSIGYNDNFKILVDGKEAEYYKLFDNFIGLDLDEGLHNIEIIYEVKGLKLGFIISLISLSLFAIYSYRLKKVIK